MLISSSFRNQVAVVFVPPFGTFRVKPAPFEIKFVEPFDKLEITRDLVLTATFLASEHELININLSLLTILLLFVHELVRGVHVQIIDTLFTLQLDHLLFTYDGHGVEARSIAVVVGKVRCEAINNLDEAGSPFKHSRTQLIFKDAANL